LTIGTTQRHPRQLTPQQVPKHLRIRPPLFCAKQHVQQHLLPFLRGQPKQPNKAPAA